MKSIFQLCFIAASLLILCQSASAETRVAVVGAHGADTADGVIALAEATLSSRDGIVILERQQIELLLKEQKLSLTGIVDAAKVVEAGKILAVDLFAFVEQSADGKETLACIVYDSATGLRLCDESLTSDGTETIANEVTSCVELAVRKRSLGLGTLRTLSVVGVRNADLPRSQDIQCQSLAMLFERDLIRSGSVALLERSRLAWLQQEQNLAATATDRKLLSSVLQADLEFSQAAGGVQATLIVTNPTGHQVHTATCDAKQLDASLLPPLIDGLAHSLDVKQDSVPANRRREAQRYFREAQLRMSFGEIPTAIQAAEAAYLLDSNDPDKTLLLTEYLFRYARAEGEAIGRHGPRPANPSTSAELMAELRRVAGIGERAIDLFVLHFRQVTPGSAEEFYQYRKHVFTTQGTCQEFFQFLPRNDTLAEADRFDLSQIQSQLFQQGLQIHRDRLQVCRNLVHANPAAATAYSHILGMELMSLWNETRDSKQAIAAARKFISNWLEEFDALSSENLPHEAVRSALGDITGSIAMRPDYSKYLSTMLDHLAEHPDPVIQFYGRRGCLLGTWRTRPESLAEGVIQFRPIRQDVMKYLAQSSDEPNSPIRRALYEFVYESLDMISPREISTEFMAEIREVCEPMLARKELHVRLVTGRKPHVDLDAARARLAIINSAIDLCQSPQYVKLDSGPSQSVRPQLERARADLLTLWQALRTDNESWQVQAQLMLELHTTGRNRPLLCHPLVWNDKVYVIVQNVNAAQGASKTLNLKTASVPLAGGSIQYSDSIDISSTASGSYFLTRVIKGTCIHNERLYVATEGGIAEFDLKTNAARIVAAAKSFPTQVAQSVASFSGQLYAGLEGGYLVSFAPDEDTCKILASSRRKQVQSPIDDRDAFDLPSLIPDPERERLLLHLTTGTLHNGAGEIWEYRPSSGEFRRLLEFSVYPAAMSNIHDGRIIISALNWFVSLDLATDNATAVSSFPLGPKLSSKRRQFTQLPLHNPVQSAGRVWLPEYQSLIGKLGTVSAKGGDEQVVPVDLPPLNPDETYAGWYVAPVDENRFLWSNHHRLWLVTPKAALHHQQTAKE